MTQDWTDDARRRLLDLRRGPGAWGYRARSAPAVEPSSLAGLALLATAGGPVDEGRAAAGASARWLASIRRPDGSLGVTVDLVEPGWPTPFAILLWSALGGFEAERSAAAGWLIGLEGTTAGRTEDDPMGHDASIVGWPWVAGTHSWVEPSATALLAIAREGKAGHPRALEGVRLLLDRAIPGGGWNLGNPVVFGTPLRPLPGPTGLALLALARLDGRSKVVESAIAYLRSALAETLAPASLGWGLLGLRAWGAEPPEGSKWLASAFEQASSRELRPAELALLLLAAGARSMEVLGISARTDRGHLPATGDATAPSPQPSPTRGEGVHQRRARTTGSLFLLAPSPLVGEVWGEGSTGSASTIRSTHIREAARHA